MSSPEVVARSLCLRFQVGFAALAVGLLAACGAGEAATSPAELPPEPAETLTVDPDPPEVPPLPEVVAETRDAILAAADRRSLRRLARLADEQSAFLSNLGNDDHYNHWYLMRATGFDVHREIEALFEEPYGTRLVGTETWYIWPDLAALDAADLLPERLSFRDRVRLKDLVGEPGIAAIQAGEPYPGVRTAIAEDGGWRYFLHETGLSQEDENGG